MHLSLAEYSTPMWQLHLHQEMQISKTSYAVQYSSPTSIQQETASNNISKKDYEQEHYVENKILDTVALMN